VGLAISASTLGPASLSHVYMTRLLAHWGDAGLEGFVTALQRKYARQAALAHAAAGRHLGGLAVWKRPTGGMFMWLRLTAIEDAMALMEAGPVFRVAVLPGQLFWVRAALEAAAAEKAAAAAAAGAAAGDGNGKAAAANSGVPAPAAAAELACPYFRVSFVSVSAEDLEEGFARLGSAIRSLQARTGVALAAANGNGAAAKPAATAAAPAAVKAAAAPAAVVTATASGSDGESELVD